MITEPQYVVDVSDAKQRVNVVIIQLHSLASPLEQSLQLEVVNGVLVY